VQPSNFQFESAGPSPNRAGERFGERWIMSAGSPRSASSNRGRLVNGVDGVGQGAYRIPIGCVTDARSMARPSSSRRKDFGARSDLVRFRLRLLGLGC
jgi:hypothetical protein